MDTIFRHAGGFGEVITTRVPTSLNQQVKEAAAKNGLTKAEFVRRTLARGIAAEGRPFGEAG